MHVDIEVLGGFRIVAGGRTVPADGWRHSRSAALVKLLLLARGHRLHREQAMEALWPEMPPEASAANLRKAVHYTRRTLGAQELILLDGETVALAAGDGATVDAEVFESAARTALATSDPEACRAAADHYVGDLLPDDRYAAWAEEPRQRLRQLYPRTLRAGRLWDRVLTLEPTDEEAQRALMQAALDRGDRGDVIRQFRRIRERLHVDLGVGPAPATVAIYEGALAQQSRLPVELADRVRASLAWGLIHLHSGDFVKAESVAREARDLALSAGLGREMGEASALLGLTAHMQGRWPDLFREEFSTWIGRDPNLTACVFEGHVCLAEFCLCGAGGHDGVAREARELLHRADDAGSVAGRALANQILGEAALFSGDLAAAEELLAESDRLHAGLGAGAGRVLVQQRLIEVMLARGQKWKAGRLLKRAFAMAESSWLAPHLLVRLQGLAVEAAPNRAAATAAIHSGDRWLAEGTMCQPCSMGFRIASATVLVSAGELEDAGRRIDETERLAGMWNGGPWMAAVLETRGLQRRAEGKGEQAKGLFREAAARFSELGRKRDQERCLAQLDGAP